jgi:hypothetical protein
MTTAFSGVVAAFVAALEAAPAVCDTIDRARTRPVSDQVASAVNVQWDGAFPQRGAIHGAPVDWTTKVTVDCYASSVRDTGDVAVDPLLQKVYERLAADTTLGGVVTDVGVPAIEIEYTSEGKKSGWARLTYVVEHRTSNLNLT